MILFGFENGYYTAPDDDDMAEHPHMSLLEPISMTPGMPVGVIPSYTYDAVMRLNNLHECIADTKHSRDEIKYNLEAGLNKENAPMIMVWTKTARLVVYDPPPTSTVQLTTKRPCPCSINDAENVQNVFGMYNNKSPKSSRLMKQVRPG